MFIWLLILVLAVPICLAVFFVFTLCSFVQALVDYRKDSTKSWQLRRSTILLVSSILTPTVLGLILWGLYQVGLLRISFM